MKTSLSKKEIRSNLETALIGEIEKMEGAESSKKVKRAVRKMSKDIAEKVRVDMKRLRRKAAKGSAHEDKALNGFVIQEEKVEH